MYLYILYIKLYILYIYYIYYIIIYLLYYLSINIIIYYNNIINKPNSAAPCPGQLSCVLPIPGLWGAWRSHRFVPIPRALQRRNKTKPRG